MRGIADGNMQFVRGDHPERGVAIFPPELMANDGDVDCSRRLRSILNAVQNASGGKKQHQHNEDRNHGPSELYLITAINLRRFLTVIVVALAVFRHGINEQSKDDRKNEPCN